MIWTCTKSLRCTRCTRWTGTETAQSLVELLYCTSPNQTEHLIHLAFTVHKKRKKIFLWSLSLVCAADNYLQCARLWEHHCHASHVWPRLCESASSCSAICPRPGSLIREESCGKVCVSLPDALLSLQLFVRVRPQQQHQGARYHIAAGAWSVLRHCGGEKLEAYQEILGTEK